MSSISYPHGSPPLKTQWITMRVKELGPAVPSLLTSISLSGASISGSVSISGGINTSGWVGPDVLNSKAYRSKMDYTVSGQQSITYIVGGQTETTLATATHVMNLFDIVKMSATYDPVAGNVTLATLVNGTSIMSAVIASG